MIALLFRYLAAALVGMFMLGLDLMVTDQFCLLLRMTTDPVLRTGLLLVVVAVSGGIALAAGSMALEVAKGHDPA